MNDYPNLDYEALKEAFGLLKQAMLKKAVTGERDPDDDMEPQVPPQQGAKTTGSPRLDQLIAKKEDLESQIIDARNHSDYSAVSRITPKLEKIKDFIQECAEDPRIQGMIEDKIPMPQIMKFLDKIIEKKQWYQQVEMRIPLEEQLERALKEERYEEAAPIHKELDRFQRLLKSRRILNQMVITADNLDVVVPDKQYDFPQPLHNVRRRNRLRFRNEPGGSDEMFWEGMSGTLNKEKGIGTDEQSNVDGPASISTVSGIKPRLKPIMRKQEQTLSGEKMERDPREERETSQTWQEFGDMGGVVGR